MATEMEKFALATRLHVLLRRKTGRVTDVEWMMRDSAYAEEVTHLSRVQGDAELLELAEKWVSARGEAQPEPPQRLAPRRVAAREAAQPLIVLDHDGRAQAVQEQYVGRLR